MKILQIYVTFLLTEECFNNGKSRIFFYNFSEFQRNNTWFIGSFDINEKGALNNVSSVLMIHLNVNASFQPYTHQNYIIMDMSLN